MLSCPKCEKMIGMRAVVNTTVDVPARVEQITKVIMRDKQTRMVSSDWSEAWYYCNLCGWSSKNTGV